MALTDSTVLIYPTGFRLVSVCRCFVVRNLATRPAGRRAAGCSRSIFSRWNLRPDSLIA